MVKAAVLSAVIAASLGAASAQMESPMSMRSRPTRTPSRTTRMPATRTRMTRTRGPAAPMEPAPMMDPPAMEDPAPTMEDPPMMEEAPMMEDPPMMEEPMMEDPPMMDPPPQAQPAMDGPSPMMGGAVTGTDILNFALNLECLEAEFYSWAAFGRGLTVAQRGGGDGATGGRKADLSPEIQAVAEEIARDEIAHVEFLRAALGDDAVPCPRVDIGEAFVAAANAAAGMTLEPAFDPYANDIFFLHGAFIFEDVGVTAYKGAVEPLSSLVDGATLGAAGGILAVEAYHAGIIHTLLAELVSDGELTPFGLPVEAVVQAISDLRDSVDGPEDLDQGVTMDGVLNLVPTDENGIAFGRTVAQTLAIVYLGGENMGGFFPRGITGFFGPQGADMPDPMVMCPGTCNYKVTVNMSWTPESHPIDFPMAGEGRPNPDGFVFPFWTVAHNKMFTMWQRGSIASAGIQEIAETGAGMAFMAEVDSCGDNCGPAVAVPCDPMGGTCSGSETVIVSSTTPYVSTAAMLAPSPDWFTGVSMWDLCDGGEWIESMSRPLPPYDAGTDVGPAFLSPNMPNTGIPGGEKGPIFSFGMVMPPEASVFYNPATGSVAPVGEITVERMGCQ